MLPSKCILVEADLPLTKSRVYPILHCMSFGNKFCFVLTDANETAGNERAGKPRKGEGEKGRQGVVI